MAKRPRSKPEQESLLAQVLKNFAYTGGIEHNDIDLTIEFIETVNDLITEIRKLRKNIIKLNESLEDFLFEEEEG